MPSRPDRVRVVFSVINCITFDQRVLKMAKAVGTLNCDITIVGRRSDDYCSSISLPFKTIRFKMIFKRGFLFYKFFNIRLLIYLLFHKYDILVSNDLDTLLPNFLVSKIKGIPLVYDSHEYFTGVPEIQNRPEVRWVWKSIESFIFPRLKYVITVSDPIAALYEKMYNVQPLVVRNFSRNADHILPFARKEIDIPENDLLVIMQGMGINIDKGAEELIEAVNLSKDVSLLVVGSGDVIPVLKKRVKELKLESRVRFIHGLPWEQLMRYTKTADIGMCLEKDTNLNYRFSLPNKLFDYISAGIPVIASDLPETSKIISEYSPGIIIEKVAPEIISGTFLMLKQERNKLDDLRKNAVRCSMVLNWESECEKVLGLYNKVLSS